MVLKLGFEIWQSLKLRNIYKCKLKTLQSPVYEHQHEGIAHCARGLLKLTMTFFSPPDLVRVTLRPTFLQTRNLLITWAAPGASSPAVQLFSKARPSPLNFLDLICRSCFTQTQPSYQRRVGHDHPVGVTMDVPAITAYGATIKSTSYFSDRAGWQETWAFSIRPLF